MSNKEFQEMQDIYYSPIELRVSSFIYILLEDNNIKLDWYKLKFNNKDINNKDVKFIYKGEISEDMLLNIIEQDTFFKYNLKHIITISPININYNKITRKTT